MLSVEHLKRERDDLLEMLDVLSQKISKLRRALAYETGTAIRFQLDEQIREAEKEREDVIRKIDELEHQIEEFERQQIDRRQLHGSPTKELYTDRPTCSSYVRARLKIDTAMMAEPNHFLDDIEYYLDQADHDEGGVQATEPIRWHLRFERARLSYLRKEFDQANEHFAELLRYFVGTSDEVIIREIDEFRQCLNIIEQLTSYPKEDSLATGHRMRIVLESLQNDHNVSRSPLLCFLLRQFRSLSPSYQFNAEILGEDMSNIRVSSKNTDDEMIREQQRTAPELTVAQQSSQISQEELRLERHSTVEGSRRES